MIGGIYLLLGSNMGDRLKNLETARGRIATASGRQLRASSIYETSAWGMEDQANFLNQIVEIESNLTPRGLLDSILEIEQAMGRVRIQKWGSRIIDIDILLYDHTIIKETALEIPHPGIPDRRFTLIPLVELLPNGVHPVTLKTFSQMLQDCRDTLQVTKVLS